MLHCCIPGELHSPPVKGGFTEWKSKTAETRVAEGVGFQLPGCFLGLRGGEILINPSKSLMDKPEEYGRQSPENRWNFNVFKEFAVFRHGNNETPGCV